MATVKSYLRGVQETVGPADLKNKSKDSTSEAFYLKGQKEKWSGSWSGARGLGVEVSKAG